MREILFRGKCIENGEWVYGAYGSHTSLDAMIINKPYPTADGDLSAIGFWEVRPNTVGQYTGLTDKDGTKIFEGDILSRDCCNTYGRIVKIVWSVELAQFCAQTPSGYGLSMLTTNGKVIGNIYDTPEILGAKK